MYMKSPHTLTLASVGCHLDNHRGHYISRDTIELAIEFGFIVGSSDLFVLSRYERDGYEDDYPSEVIHELCNEAIAWLNAGQDERVSGQNFPPIIPEGYSWGFNDGDFGLYSDTEDETCWENDLESCPDCGNGGIVMTDAGYRHCVRFHSCWADGLNPPE